MAPFWLYMPPFWVYTPSFLASQGLGLKGDRVNRSRIALGR